MWGGIEFFVSIEVLLSATIPSSFQSALASSSGSKASRSSSSSSASPTRYAGNPCTHRVAFTRERRPTSFFIYPNATLFLQVLRSSGNRVHLITPWSKEDTSAILKACDWVELLTDARRVFHLPHTTDYSFASLGIDPASYVRTVLVVDDAARWNASTALQLVEVRHDRDAVHSMELLYAMSRCVHYAEWLLRYPLSSIASCVAMTNTILFAYCRFFFRGGDVNTELMLLVSFHGGRVVASEAEATHVVVLPPPEPLSSSSSTTSSSEGDTDGSSSSSGEESAVDSSDADTSSDGDDADGRKKGELTGRRGKGRPFGGTDRSSTSKAESNEDPTAQPLAASPSSLSGATATRVLAPPATVNGSSSPTATAAAALPPLPVRAPAAVVSPAALSVSSVRTVTPAWVYRCVRALRVVPVDADDDDDSEGEDVADAASGASHEEQGGRNGQSAEEGRRRAAHQSTLLLCCLLPPPDVGPLLWTTFCSIARQHHYDLRCFADGSSSSSRRAAEESMAVTNSAKHRSSSPLTFTAMKVLAALTEPSLSDVVEVRLLPSASEAKPTNGAAPTRPRGFAVNSTTLPTLRLSSAAAELSRLALFRVSRRLDKEAVLAHLQLTASQFLVSYEHVLRRRSRLMHVDAGTQTSGPRHASMGVMTEKVDLDDGEKDGASSESAPSVSPRDSGEHTTSPTQSTATAAEDTGAVDAEAWRHHLKNVEGKLLSHHPAAKKDAAARESAAVVSGDGASSSCTRKEVAAAAGQRVETVPEKADASSGASSPPPPPPQLRTSFTSPPSVSAPAAQAGQRALPIDVDVAPPEAHPGEYTACFIPTVYLSPTQEDDFFEELRSYPIFASPELGNRVVRLPDGVKCVFASHDAAEGFHRIDYIEYLSLRLPIYPFFEDPQPQQAEMNFPLPPSLPTAVNTTTPTAAAAAATTASPQLLWKVCETPSYFPMDAHGPSPPPSSFSPPPSSASSSRPPPLSASQRRGDHHNSSGGSRGRDSGPAPPRRLADAPPPPLASHPPHRRQRDDLPGSPRRSPPRRQRRSDERRSRGSDDARDRRDRVDRYEGRSGSYSSHRRRHDDSVEPPRRGESGSSGFRPHYRSRRDSR